MLFVVKILVAAVLIALASSVAGRKPVLAGFIIALPLTSMIAILFAYVEHQDMLKINKFTTSIVAAVPLSMLFFIPFICHKWLKLNFVASFLMGTALLAAGYLIHTYLFKMFQG